METNWPWSWRLTVLKTVEVTLIRPPMTNVNVTARANSAVSACSPLPLSIKALVHWLSMGVAGEVGLWTAAHPQVASLQNKAKFPFRQPGLFTGFWAASSQTLRSVTLLHLSPFSSWPPSQTWRNHQGLEDYHFKSCRKYQHRWCFILHDPWWYQVWPSHYGQVIWSTTRVLFQWNPTAIL